MEPGCGVAVAVPLAGGGPRTRTGPGRCQCSQPPCRHHAWPFPSRRLVYVSWSNTARLVRFRQLQPISAPSPHSQNSTSMPLLGFWTTHTQTLAAYHLSLQRSRISTKFAARIAGKNSLKSPRCQFGSVALPSSLAYSKGKWHC